MGEYNSTQLDHLFHALAHPVRRDMLGKLQQRSRCVTDLAGDFDLSLNVVSKHLKSLERAGLIERTRTGRVHHLASRPEAVQPASRWLAEYLRFWTGTLDSLEQFLERDPPSSPPPPIT